MTQWGLDTLFNPAKRHMDEEKRRLQSTREEIGDSSGGKRIDLESGRVTIRRDGDGDGEQGDGEQGDGEQGDGEQGDGEQGDGEHAASPARPARSPGQPAARPGESAARARARARRQAAQGQAAKGDEPAP